MRHLISGFLFLAISLNLFHIKSVEARPIYCKNFNTQSQAQNYFYAKKPGWKKLDGDKDGEACECLKGGSSYHKKVCIKWRKKHGKP